MELKNKRVLVVGLGKSGMAAALFLRDKGARVTVSAADFQSTTTTGWDAPRQADGSLPVLASLHLAARQRRISPK